MYSWRVMSLMLLNVQLVGRAGNRSRRRDKKGPFRARDAQNRLLEIV